MAPVEIRSSRARAAGLVLAAIVMTAGSAFLAVVVPQDELHGPLLALGPTGIRVVGWVGVAFFALGIGAAVARLLDRRPRVVLGPDGLWARDLKLGTIAWEDLSDVRLVEMSGVEMVGLAVPEARLANLSRAVRALAAANLRLVGVPFALPATGLEVDARALLDLITRFRAEHGRRIA